MIDYSHPKKLYYSTPEVAKLVRVPSHRIRNWCKIYGIRIRKWSGGDRKFDNHEVDIMFAIYKLLYIDKYSSKGVRKIIKEFKKRKHESR